jgi:hypothetical protein
VRLRKATAVLLSAAAFTAGCTGTVSGSGTAARSSAPASTRACKENLAREGDEARSGHRPFRPVVPGRLPGRGRVVVAGVQLVGRPITAHPGGENAPVMWVTDDVQLDAGICWMQLFSDYPRTGLYPVVLPEPDSGADNGQPWLDGELDTVHRTSPDRLGSPSALLTRLYREQLSQFGGPRAATDPPRRFPGLARTSVGWFPSAVVHSVGPHLLGRIGLIPVARPADLPYAIGWEGPANYFDAGYVTAVLRSWEDRFGAFAIQVGLDYVDLGVTDPPDTLPEARRAAAETIALCPDEYYQGDSDNFDDFARSLIDSHSWECWWD